MGVKIDMNAIRSTGVKSLVIGLSGLVFSLSLGSLAFYVVRQNTQLDQSLFTGIRLLITFNSLTFFMVTSGYNQDLKFCNTELGHLACSSSLAVDLPGLVGATVCLTWFGTNDTSSDEYMAPRLVTILSVSLYYAVLFCILRPMVMNVVSRTPKGATTMKQTHLMLILVILMLAWYWGEALGQRFATFLFGLSLPDGPPLGSALAQKVELFTSGILLPIFCTMVGWRTNLSSWKGNPQIWGVELIFVIAHLGKLLGTVVSSTLVGVSFEDAIPLGFMMSFKGIMEVATLAAWNEQALLDDRLFSLSMLNIVLFTGVAFPLAQHLYDPSKRYKVMRRRNILGIDNLQVLICIHSEEYVPGLLNLIQLMNNMSGNISLFTIQLIHLSGSSMPILEPLYKYKKSACNFVHFEHAVNAFNQLEDQGRGRVSVQHFVSVTPYKSMHNHICTLAHDKGDIIITPFNKIWDIYGNVETCSPQIREVNKRMIPKAPCTVAILIDKKSQVAGSYHIVMLFIGGSDDQEALALSCRMAEHPSVRLSVIWLKSSVDMPLLNGSQQDIRLMEDLQMKTTPDDNITIREEYVADGIGTTKVVLSMQHADLFVVGKYHEPQCPAIQGLAAWNDNPEIGALGDVLATSDFLFSILVVQREPLTHSELHSSAYIGVDDFSSLSSFNETPKSNQSHLEFSRLV
ncbi:cation/H(+) antiporter 14-like [Silene latifolia]|uniref:cation/H(+) antiporter 14-like n=1 Tax=Silene latifolia TaxID=37657 RepID=UPI003D7794B2